MNAREAEAFFEQNRDALLLLGERLKVYGDIRNEMAVSFDVRREAIQLVEDWIKEAWGIKTEQPLYSLGDEDNIIRRLEKEEQS